MFVYKIDVLSALKAAGYTTYRLRREKLLGESAIQKLRENKVIGIVELNNVCQLLQCQPGDLIEWVPGESKSGDD